SYFAYLAYFAAHSLPRNRRQIRIHRLHDLPPRRRQAPQEFWRGAIPVPEVSPARAVSVDANPALAWIHARRRAVHDRVDEHDRLRRAADVGEAFVDEQGAVVIIERSLAADERAHFLDPRGLIDQFLERFACLINLLKIQSFLSAVIMSLHPAGPVVFAQVLQ